MTMKKKHYSVPGEETSPAQESAKLYELKKTQTDFPNIQITSSNDSERFIRNFYFDDIDVYESVFILMLNASLYTIGYAKISQGGVTGSVVDPRLVGKYALDSLASAVILAHNHPSGNTKPSKEDIQITHKIKLGLELFEIDLIDHLILTHNNKYSFADQGIL